MLRFVTVCTISYLLLGRVDFRAQRAIVIKLSRGRPVGLCVGLSSAFWKNGGSDLDAVFHHRSDGCRYEAGSGVCGSVHAKGYFWGAPLQPMGTLRRTCRLSQRRGPLPKLLWADLFYSFYKATAETAEPIFTLDSSNDAFP